MRGRDSMSEAGTGYINLADTTTNIIARNTRQIAQPHLCMVDARLLTMLNIFALFGVAGRLFYFSPLYTEVLKGPYDEDLIRSLLPYVFLGFYLLGLLLLETVSSCDGLATRRCCGMAFTPCGRLLLLTVAAALMLPITPVDHGREESICAIAILCTLANGLLQCLLQSCNSTDPPYAIELMSAGHEANRLGYTASARKNFLEAAKMYQEMGDTQRMAAAKISAANMGLKLGHAKQAGEEYRGLLASELNGTQRQLVASKIAELDIEAPGYQAPSLLIQQ
jgi:hypothetical protein